VLDGLFTSFIPLRDGMRRLETDFAVKMGEQTDVARAPAGLARTPAELAARLLDWNDRTDSVRSLKRFFADLLVHQVGLVNGVMRGAATLLDQLSPEALEGELEADRARGVAPIAVGPLRHRALWDVLRRRHHELASEEKERTALLFGSDFASAYAALTNEARVAKTPELSRPKTDRPEAAVTRTSVRPAPRLTGPMGTEHIEEAPPPPPRRDVR